MPTTIPELRSGETVTVDWGTTVSDVWDTWWTTNATISTGNAVYMNTTTSGNTLTVGDPWAYWNVDRSDPRRSNAFPPHPVTAEEQEAREERQREAREANRERQRLAVAVQERAEALLRMTLSPDELEHYDQSGRVVITGSNGRRYQIVDGVVGNVALLDEDNRALANLCAHPVLHDSERRRIPNRDAHAAQILALKTDALAFHRTANVDFTSRGRGQLDELREVLYPTAA